MEKSQIAQKKSKCNLHSYATAVKWSFLPINHFFDDVCDRGVESPPLLNNRTHHEYKIFFFRLKQNFSELRERKAMSIQKNQNYSQRSFGAYSNILSQWISFEALDCEFKAEK